MAWSCQGQCHGGVVQVDIFPFTDASCKLVDDGRKHEGWIQSWRDMVGLPPHVEDFLYHLLAWPSCPMVWWPDDDFRTEAPLFIAAHHGRKVAAECCFVQFGCHVCKHRTARLYYAGDDTHQKHAVQQMITFFEPLLDQYLYRRFIAPVLSLKASNLDIIANPPARPLPPTQPPPPATPPPPTIAPPKMLRDSEAPSSEGKWTKYIWKTYWQADGKDGHVWWYNDVTEQFFFEETGTTQIPTPSTLGKCCGKESKISPDDEDLQSTEADDDSNTVAFSDSNASSSVQSSFPIGSPSPGYTGRCTHRTYERNLYAANQPPSILEGDVEG